MSTIENSNIGLLIKQARVSLGLITESALYAHDLSFTHYVILSWLRDGRVMTAGDICCGLGYPSGAVTRLVDRLATKGFVERDRLTSNRRKMEIRLTSAGSKALEFLTPIVVGHLNDALAKVSTDECSVLEQLLTKFNSSLV